MPSWGWGFGSSISWVSQARQRPTVPMVRLQAGVGKTKPSMS